MDMTEAIAPNSDQLDAVDLLAGPRTFTIERVSEGNAEQKVNIHLAEFDRPWRPGKSMARVLVKGWGVDASAYIGRRVTLFCDPDVTFGKDKVGGTRISHMSDIGDKPLSVPLLISRGKTSTYVVQPLAESVAPTRDEWEAKIASSNSIEELRGWWQLADPKARNLIEARVADLQAQADA